MICVSLSGPSALDCRQSLAGLEFAEIRLDAMDLSPSEVADLFACHPKLVATCRPGRGRSDAQRRALLEAALDAGAAYLDMELEAPAALREPLAARARAAGCRLIISHHDHRSTPAGPDLRALREACFAAGADLAKVACAVETPRDVARLLGLLDDPAPTVVVGMGRLGAVSRLAAPLLGAPFTYACLEPGRETAPGQLDHRRLARLLSELWDG